MKKTKLLAVLIGIGVVIGVLASTLQLDPPTPQTIAVSEEARASLLTEDWTVLSSVFEGSVQLGIYNVSEHEVLLDTTLPAVPGNLMVYEVLKPVFNEAFAREIRDKFGFSGELIPADSDKDRRAYVYTNDTHVLEVEYDRSILFYRKTLSKTGTLPTEEECITIAETWLKEHDLYPSNISRVTVGVRLAYDGKPLVLGVRFWRKVGEYPLESGPYVTISSGGVIHEVILTVYEFQPYASFKLKTPLHALKILKAYLDVGAILPTGQQSNCRVNYILFERLVVQDISLEYYRGRNYLDPVYIVRGEADGESFKGIVDAVDRSRGTLVLVSLLLHYAIDHYLPA